MVVWGNCPKNCGDFFLDFDILPTFYPKTFWSPKNFWGRQNVAGTRPLDTPSKGGSEKPKSKISKFWAFWVVSLLWPGKFYKIFCMGNGIL
jgi:hypothetical protein